jgi:predicted nucleic acid-binding Zn ribbon protein
MRKPFLSQKICVVCGSQYFPKHPNHKTCGERCGDLNGWRRDGRHRRIDPVRRAKDREHRRRWDEKNKDRAREWARQRYLKNRRSKTCVMCSSQFYGLGKTCSKECREINARVTGLRNSLRSNLMSMERRRLRVRRCLDCNVILEKRFKRFSRKCSRCAELSRRRSARASRFNLRAKMKSTLRAAIELGLLDRSSMDSKRREVAFKAVKELGLIREEKRHGEC